MIFVKDIAGKDIDFIKFISNKNYIVFTYPKMGESGKFLPDELVDLKGLTGCTNQCKTYQDSLKDILNLGFEIIAIGSQSVDKMKEFKDGIGADFTFFSDENFNLEKALNLQTFETNDGKKFYHRQTLIIKNGTIIKRFNKIAKPQEDALNAIEAIKNI